jgi:MinD-like ATPase involved in chromosome partitioning or flagellar assembly/tetratricopeptide (TPR) repeat protein
LYIITFYSFKGGVGRTMALVNTAAELARRGRKVLLVDFDLEAPGLSTYDLLRPPKSCPGIVEYVTEFRHTRRSPLVTDFIYEAGQVGKKGGKLWVMPAGRRDGEYRRMLNGLNWRTLYQDEEGFLLFEDTRLQWEAELHPDYVLIDARTGHTDIEGICTRQLANAVAVVFYPNEQNLVGLREVCRHIQAEETSGLKKEIKLHYVASNVPDLDDEDHYLRRHLSQFRADLDIPHAPIPIIHRNETLQMLDQPIFVLQRPHSRLAREYRFLVRALQIENPEDREGALLFLREVQKGQSRLIDWGYEWGWERQATRRQSQGEDASLHPREWRVPHPVRDRVNRITGQFWNDSEILLRVGQYILQCREPDLALKRLNRALELQPGLAEALFERALCRRQLRDDMDAAEDLFHYLRDHGSQVPSEWEGLDLERLEPLSTVEQEKQTKIRIGQKRNETALLELLSISLDWFLKTLDLPPVQLSQGYFHHDAFWLFCSVIYRLIEQRHWDDAIRCIEHPKITHLIETSHELVPGSWRSHRAFCLAIAQWGKAGEPRRESCLQALRACQPALESTSHQSLSLLYWGAGDRAKAADTIDQALAELDETYGGGDVSYWTFCPATACEYRQDCEEIRRMIQGEAVRPAFLGPPC